MINTGRRASILHPNGDRWDEIMIIRKLAEQSEEDLISKINKVVMLQPNIAGIGVNINELIEIARHWLRNK